MLAETPGTGGGGASRLLVQPTASSLIWGGPAALRARNAVIVLVYELRPDFEFSLERCSSWSGQQLRRSAVSLSGGMVAKRPPLRDEGVREGGEKAARSAPVAGHHAPRRDALFVDGGPAPTALLASGIGCTSLECRVWSSATRPQGAGPDRRGPDRRRRRSTGSDQLAPDQLAPDQLRRTPRHGCSPSNRSPGSGRPGSLPNGSGISSPTVAYTRARSPRWPTTTSSRRTKRSLRRHRWRAGAQHSAR